MNKKQVRLLIVTQAVDKEDETLGFFHRWLEVFSIKFEKITVICLQRGKVNLPGNISIHSLGKEMGTPRFFKLVKLLRYIVVLRKNYDAVLVHMNQEYVLIGGVLWWLMGKKIFLWRNHPYGNLLTRIAIFLSHKVFCTSPTSFTARFKKTVMMPVGIDTDFFSPDQNVVRNKGEILFLGRIAPIKRPDLFVKALLSLKGKTRDFRALIVGNNLSKDAAFVDGLKSFIGDSNLDELVTIRKGVSHNEARNYYRKTEIYVNLTPTGSLDKTIFEAMASGALPLVANPFFKEQIPGIFWVEGKSESVAEGMERVLLLADDEKIKYRTELRQYVIQNHSLDLLAKGLQTEINAL